jgi:SAM-dependent methyltransferase
MLTLTGIDQGTVLDLCCGPGRHSIPLAGKGFQVTAVDLQSILLAKAQAYANSSAVDIEFIQANMLEFDRPDAFDLVISMFSSFGYFSNPEDDFRVLENACSSLKDGGQLLIDVRGKEIHAMSANMTSFSQRMPNGDMIYQHAEVTDDWTSTRSEWVYVERDRAHRFEIHFNLYSAAELRLLLESAGFTTVRIFGDLKGSPYDHNATRLVALAQK